jgi:IclR family KDG regulon transcriptional repressor
LTGNLTPDYCEAVRLTTVQRVGPALDLFDEKAPEWGVTEVAGALGTSKSTAHALLTTMEAVGLLERTARARYRLGWRLLSLSSTLVRTTAYRPVVLKAMRRVVERWDESMHLAVFDRGCVIYLECVRGRRSRGLPTRAGLRLPAHPSAVGKTLLAHRNPEEINRHVAATLRRYTRNTIVDPDRIRSELSRVRAQGHALDCEEAIAGLCCVAAPVRDADGSVVAAVSLSAPTARFERHADDYLRLVRATASAGSGP